MTTKLTCEHIALLRVNKMTCEQRRALVEDMDKLGVYRSSETWRQVLQEYDAKRVTVHRSLLEVNDGRGNAVDVSAIVQRLRILSQSVANGPEDIARESTMSVPARPERDADIVLSIAAEMIKRVALALGVQL